MTKAMTPYEVGFSRGRYDKANAYAHGAEPAPTKIAAYSVDPKSWLAGYDAGYDSTDKLSPAATIALARGWAVDKRTAR